MERLVLIEVVVDDTVSIAVKRAAAVEWGGVRAWRGSLFGLDVVGATLDTVLTTRHTIRSVRAYLKVESFRL
jgi:hypothetical protein